MRIADLSPSMFDARWPGIHFARASGCRLSSCFFKAVTPMIYLLMLLFGVGGRVKLVMNQLPPCIDITCRGNAHLPPELFNQELEGAKTPNTSSCSSRLLRLSGPARPSLVNMMMHSHRMWRDTFFSHQSNSNKFGLTDEEDNEYRNAAQN